MTPLETQTISTILNHPHLKQEDKEKYIAAFLLMGPGKQAEFAKLFEHFDERCTAIEQGNFLLNHEEQGRLSALFQGIKDRLLLKLKK
ncbi:hypothetical protein HZA43_03935 [Candidatus Peregrinibacteria bacterium]|nr:hypothetical protein [Candidatus Peregrinibacteria bacterium]